MSEGAAAIKADRSKRYGNPEPAHRAVGLVWAGLLSNHFQMHIPPIPPHVVAYMMSSMKHVRCVAPNDVKTKDSHVDSIIYADLGYEMDLREEG
jgi:hypothetical protein